MHIPDAVLSPTVAAATSVVAIGGLAVCLGKLRHHLQERTPVLMGVMSAFVFAAQMVNFPLFPMPISSAVSCRPCCLGPGPAPSLSPPC